MLKKRFGGIRMTWPRLILFAAVSGVVTALIALLAPDGNSIRQIAVTFEARIVPATLLRSTVKSRWKPRARPSSVSWFPSRRFT